MKEDLWRQLNILSLACSCFYEYAAQKILLKLLLKKTIALKNLTEG